MDRRLLGMFLVVFSAAGFGLMPILARYAYQGGIGIPTLLFVRFALAAGALFVFLLAGGGRPAVGVRRLSILLLLGVLYALQSSLYFYALRRISASLTALLLYTYPILVALLTMACDRERPAAGTAVALLLSFAGLALALGVGPAGIDPLGAAMACGAAAVYSCYIVLGRRLVKDLPPLATSAFVSLFACLSFLAAGLAGGGLSFAFSPAVWWPVAGIVVFSTAGAILCFFKGLELIGSTSASILSMSEPLVTMGLAALFLGERLGMAQIAGFAMVLAGSGLILAPKNGRPGRAAA
ncbi:MAG: DMT family transporter [Patescibacteria group bacterium]